MFHWSLFLLFRHIGVGVGVFNQVELFVARVFRWSLYLIFQHFGLGVRVFTPVELFALILLGCHYTKKGRGYSDLKTGQLAWRSEITTILVFYTTY